MQREADARGTLLHAGRLEPPEIRGGGEFLCCSLQKEWGLVAA